MINEFRINSPLDMHIHFREGTILKHTVPVTAKFFSGAVVMPNLLPPLTTFEKLKTYRAEIISVADNPDFIPYMTLFFKEYDQNFLEKIREEIIGIKLYPSGITTNSDGGIKNLSDAEKTLHILEELDIPLLVHGETNDFVMDREKNFGSQYEIWAKKFPKLRIIMEHITDRHTLRLLEDYNNLYATVTVHHLLYTLDDLAGGLLNPHLFCKPILKTPADRQALIDAVASGSDKIMFGSDSAPHPRDKKESAYCAAGVFSSPVALQYLAEVFSKYGTNESFEKFVSTNAQIIYRITPPKKHVRLFKSENIIPDNFGGIAPMNAGQSLFWDAELLINN
ncbi:MAG: dihydroorotase [Ignavibacteriales bacterium]|nr:dihydroorotase [Ignavibacteriales bacterium]MCF8314581.1 dihydroorotase [Ignavibacteriales bacterium]MCF8436382.1 dihydroorotase [Ignavibacteriales bacterium]